MAHAINALRSRLQPDQSPAPVVGDDYQLPPMCQKVESTVEPLQEGLEKIAKLLKKCSVKHKSEEALSEAFRNAAAALGDKAPQLSYMLEAMHRIESDQLRNRASMYELLTSISRENFKEREDKLKLVAKQRRDIAKLAEDLAKTRKRLAQQQQQPQPQQQAIEDLQVEMGAKTAELRRQRDAYANSLTDVVGLHSDCCADLLAMLRARLAYHRDCAEMLAERDRLLKDELARITRTSGPCYRVELDDHLEVTERQVAYVLQACVQALNKQAVLEEEGLFRTNGSASAVLKLESYLNLMQAEEHLPQFEASAICGALKKYLKSLPSPLVGSGQLIDSWREACQIDEPDKRLEALLACCARLKAERPQFHRNLRYLVKFLVRVARQQDKNKMSAKNLGICIGPNIFYDCGQASGMSEMEAANIGSQLIENLINWHEKLFGPEDPDFGGDQDSSLECPMPPPVPRPQSPLPPTNRPPSDTVQPRRPPPPRQASFNTASGADAVDRAQPPPAAVKAESIPLRRPKPPPPPQQQPSLTTQAELPTTEKPSKKPADSAEQRQETAEGSDLLTASAAAASSAGLELPASYGMALQLPKPSVPPPPPPPPSQQPAGNEPAAAAPAASSPLPKKRLAPQPPRPPPPSPSAAAAAPAAPTCES